MSHRHTHAAIIVAFPIEIYHAKIKVLLSKLLILCQSLEKFEVDLLRHENRSQSNMPKIICLKYFQQFPNLLPFLLCLHVTTLI